MANKITKPKLEDVINEVLTGDAYNNALDFVMFLRENKITTPWSATNSWKLRFKGKNIGFISTFGTAPYRGLAENSWHICFTDSTFVDNDTVCDRQYALTEKQKNIVWDTLRNCQKCPYLCNPGKPMTIFGKEFDSVCHQWLSLVNPDADALESAKKMVLLCKNTYEISGR